MSARYQGKQDPGEWQAGTTQMLVELRALAKRVIVLAPPPETGNLQSCFTRLSDPKDCSRPVSDRWRSYARAEQAAVAGLAAFVDSRPWFCAGDRCPAVVGDSPVLFDGRHLSAEYAAALAPLMAPSLK
jgi:lysophospholipase L1-like esterase